MVHGDLGGTVQVAGGDEVFISILGPVEATSGGAAVRLSPLERNLIGVLALNQGRVVSVGRLRAALWPDPPTSFRNRLQALASTLRQKLDGCGAAGSSCIATRHPGYALLTDRAHTDLARFEVLCTRARAERVAGRLESASADYRSALALWRGPALDGSDIADEDGALARLVEVRLGVLEEAVLLDLELGRHAALISELRSLIAVFPLQERWRVHLMAALARCGRQAEALEVYRLTYEYLTREIGIEPCVELREAHQAILARQ
jgi:DNA-binding SARP family transcriptional activator